MLGKLLHYYNFSVVIFTRWQPLFYNGKSIFRFYWLTFQEPVQLVWSNLSSSGNSLISTGIKNGECLAFPRHYSECWVPVFTALVISVEWNSLILHELLYSLNPYWYWHCTLIPLAITYALKLQYYTLSQHYSCEICSMVQTMMKIILYRYNRVVLL